MCGIAGFLYQPGGTEAAAAERTLRSMTDCLAHRGPDAEGVWVDSDRGVALGQRRLAIIDLSAEGRQPMASASGRYMLVFNGECYNYEEIRRELGVPSATRWRGHSDTEVVLEGFERWGIPATLGRMRGMFAFALWDRDRGELTLARDRAGEKPLYYGRLPNGTIAFASELKALRMVPGFDGRVDRTALGLYAQFGYVPAPHTIYEGVRKLPPATRMTLTAASRDGALPDAEAYWSARDAAARGLAAPFGGSDAEAILQLDALLRDAVSSSTVSDVPVGAFLSGGVDSSSVVALMQATRSEPVRTFTIGFTETQYDESPFARAVAKHLGTDHTEMLVTPREAMDVVPMLPRMYDEPFSDSSQIPTYLVSALARKQVTVSLSGDGGDELFGGYVRHVWGPRLWRRLRVIPRPARQLAAQLTGGFSAETLDAVARPMMRLLPGKYRVQRAGEKLSKAARVLGAEDGMAIYTGLVTLWPSGTVLSAVEANGMPDVGSMADLTDHMMLTDLVTYLPDDILVKLDRAAMAVALEGRVPLLDWRVIEFAWRLRRDQKIRDGQGKWILRQVLKRYVPDALMARPKMGFGIPVGAWLRGPLRDWASALLAPERLRSDGFFAEPVVSKAWQRHLAGAGDLEHPLWAILMFQSWWEASRPTAGAKAV